MNKLLLLLLCIIVILTIISFIFIPSSSRVSFGVGLITGLICESVILLLIELIKQHKTTNISVKSNDQSIATFVIQNGAVTDFNTSGSSAVSCHIE